MATAMTDDDDDDDDDDANCNDDANVHYVIDNNDDNGTDHCYDNENENKNEKDVDLLINKGETDNYWNNNIGHDDAMAMTIPLTMTFLLKIDDDQIQ